MDASVAVSQEVVVKFARFEDLKITSVNVLSQNVLTHPPTAWANGSRDKISARREKNQIYLSFSEPPPNFCLRQPKGKAFSLVRKQKNSLLSRGEYITFAKRRVYSRGEKCFSSRGEEIKSGVKSWERTRHGGYSLSSAVEYPGL